MYRCSVTVAARVVLFWLMVGVAVSGCARSGPTVPVSGLATTSPDTSRTGAPSPALVVGEVERELAAMRFTHYQHTTRVDENVGSYRYDCSGLLDYVLGRVVPGDAKALPISTSVRPLAGDIEHYLHGGLGSPISGWQAVTRIDELTPGDVVAWLATEDSTTGDTGHVMVVLASPTRSVRTGEWLVRVADSTLNPHASDSRRPGDTGLGAGTIGLVADDSGAPTAFYWRGGLSNEAKHTEISLGRPL